MESRYPMRRYFNKDKLKNRSRSDDRNGLRNRKLSLTLTDPQDEDTNVQLDRARQIKSILSDQSQLSLIIDGLDKFVEKSQPPSPDAAGAEFSDFNACSANFEKMLYNLTVNKQTRGATMKRLKSLRGLILTKMEYFSKLDFDKEGATKIPSLLDLINIGDTAGTNRTRESSVSSEASSGDEELRINCPLCNQNISDRIELVKHLDLDCTMSELEPSNVHKKRDYSYFQLLPNNVVKCNLCMESLGTFKNKLNHTKNRRHIEMELQRENPSVRRDRSRPIANTDFIFCSSCKVNIPDNKTQYKLHLKRKEHDMNRNITPNMTDCPKDYHLFLLILNKINCSLCQVTFSCIGNNLMQHLERSSHKQTKRFRQIHFDKVYCLLCRVEFMPYQQFEHMKSLTHTSMEAEFKQDIVKFEYCIFCDEKFDDLKALANHVKSDCTEMKSLRDQKQPYVSKISVRSEEEKKLSEMNDNHTNPLQNVKGSRNHGSSSEKHHGKSNNKAAVRKTKNLNDLALDLDDVSLSRIAMKILHPKAISVTQNELLKLNQTSNNEQINDSIKESISECIGECVLIGSWTCGVAFPHTRLLLSCSPIFKLDVKPLQESKNFDEVVVETMDEETCVFCKHVESGRECAVVIRHFAGVELTVAVKFCIEADERVQPLLLLLNFWFLEHREYLEEISDHTWTLMEVFFLKSQGIKQDLQEYHFTNFIKRNGQLLQEFTALKMESNAGKNLTVGELFKKFFEFYSKFDFDNIVISFTPVNLRQYRQMLEECNPESLDDNFTQNECLFVTDSRITVNTAKGVSRRTLNHFFKLAQLTASL